MRRRESLESNIGTQLHIVGTSPPIRWTLAEACRVAPASCAVLIRGPTGSGKELVARFIHGRSGRSGPFVAVNCGTIAGNLVDAELFGFVKGAFTGAVQDKIGVFQQADGGTLFLDELGELPLETQVRILRVIQEKVTRPVGAVRDIPVDVRILSATHRDIEEMVNRGHFREDLYYRLVEATVTVPALHERKTDIPAIARYLLAQERKARGERYILTHEAARALMAYSWPGNVRELRIVLRELVRRCRGRRIRAYLVRQVLTSRPGDCDPVPVDIGRELVAAIHESRGVSAVDLCCRLNLSRTSLLRQLAPLLKDGVVERVGSGPSIWYRMADDVGTCPVVPFVGFARARQGHTTTDDPRSSNR